MAKKTTAPKAAKAPAAVEPTTPSREGWPPTGTKLPYEQLRRQKVMLRHSLSEKAAWKKCAARKPLATFVRDVVNEFTKTCGGNG